MIDLGNRIPSTGRDMEASAGFEPATVSLEGPGHGSTCEAVSGADDRNRTGLCFVGNDADHLDRIRINSWLLRVESNHTSPSYQLDALAVELLSRNKLRWSGHNACSRYIMKLRGS